MTPLTFRDYVGNDVTEMVLDPNAVIVAVKGGCPHSSSVKDPSDFGLPFKELDVGEVLGVEGSLWLWDPGTQHFLHVTVD